jgi:hypothetical protein
LFSCNKRKEAMPVQPAEPVFLKDITIPNIPSPHYHFEYDSTGKYKFVSFAAGLRMYDVIYDGDKISVLRNNTFVNHDTLRYTYDAGRVTLIKYINDFNEVYKRCFLTYTGDKLQIIEWELSQGINFIVDRTMTFTYLPDGNLSQMNDHHPAINGQPEAILITKFEQYDNKLNKDDFSLVHENGNPHMLLLPVQLQKNNPRKVIRTGTGLNYTIDYTYTYNDKNAILTKTGDLVWTNGPNTGQHFQTNATFTYY